MADLSVRLPDDVARALEDRMAADAESKSAIVVRALRRELGIGEVLTAEPWLEIVEQITERLDSIDGQLEQLEKFRQYALQRAEP
jgi:predicted transcriptional regulator